MLALHEPSVPHAKSMKAFLLFGEVVVAELAEAQAFASTTAYGRVDWTPEAL